LKNLALKNYVHITTTIAWKIQTIFRVITIVCVALAFLGASAIGKAQVPQGVFSITNGGQAPSDDVLNNPDVDGITIRQDWATLEPIEGQFDFTYIDTTLASVAAAKKKALIRILTQSAKPAWVTTAIKNAGGKFFSFTTGRKSATIPVFWDPTYLQKKTAMIAALGAHIGSNPTVAIVVASFANASSEDWSVPHTPQYVTEWKNLGYTTDNLIGAGHTIIDATMAAFPNSYVTFAVGGNGTKLDQGYPDPANYVANTVINDERARWPNRLIVQKNDLSTFIPASPGVGTIYGIMNASAPDIAGQMLYQCINDSSYRVNKAIPMDPALELTISINNALGYGEKYIEIYQVDVVNLHDVIGYAHDALTAQ